ncbi:MAG: hypothetical protein HYY24_02400 [Verrucomicrobia bacterium]|nr:hypothetical protein [Verrucomicrobiota bacterium]
MSKLQRIAFVVEEFTLRSPTQQLLDRFLLGYPRDGEFHRLENCRIAVHLAGGGESAEIEQRRRDFGLAREPDLARTIADADAAIVVWRGAGAAANDALLSATLSHLPRGSACFVHGVLASSHAAAKEAARLAASHSIALSAGTATAVTFRLPEMDVPPGTPLKEALIVVEGAFPDAELDALEGLLPILERRRGGESGVRQIHRLEGQQVWDAGDEGRWSRALLASAISRSHTPQGDPVRDGRTQDLAGLGLLPKLALSPRAWLLDHRDGLRSALLVLDGAIADINFAVRTASGKLLSAQLYRPPPPAQEHLSRLTAVIEDFFRTRQSPWPTQRNLLLAGLMESFGKR